MLNILSIVCVIMLALGIVVFIPFYFRGIYRGTKQWKRVINQPECKCQKWNPFSVELSTRLDVDQLKWINFTLDVFCSFVLAAFVFGLMNGFRLIFI